MKIIYPNPEKIIEHNLLVLNILKVKKADKAEVLSYQKLAEITEGCESLEGGIYDKAVYLLKNIIQKHTFASGNRRTAFMVTKYFLHNNKAVFKIKDEPKYAKIMIGIRENYYEEFEIKEWIKYGKIREFRRR